MPKKMYSEIIGHEQMLASKIKCLRTEILELSQIDMATMLDVTGATISYWESDESKMKPRARMLIRIALTFGVSIDYLFGLSDEVTLK